MVTSNSIAEERVKPGAWLPPWTITEHSARYDFASKFVSGRQVVDCACGNGVGARMFLKNTPKGFHGFDVDQNAVDYASEQLAQQNVTFERASALSLPLGNESADLFISLETIEHIQDDNGLVKEVYRVLKPGGRFICSTPNRLITNPGALLEDAPWNHFHVREYSPQELSEILGKYFEIEKWYGQNKNLQWKVDLLNWIAKMFSKKAAVLINQLLKCRWFLFANKTTHIVAPAEQPQLHEYLIVVCRRKAT